jgi:hypothetical protein
LKIYFLSLFVRIEAGRNIYHWSALNKMGNLPKKATALLEVFVLRIIGAYKLDRGIANAVDFV